MKIRDFVNDWSIQVSNEEQMLLDRVKKAYYFDQLTEREKIIAENLIKKSIISKVDYNGSTVIITNDKL